MSLSGPHADTAQPDARDKVEEGVDPRIDNALRASTVEIDQGYLSQVQRHSSSANTARGDAEKSQPSASDSLAKDDIIYVDFEPNDPRNPFNFTKKCVCAVLH
jgi:hypothetical protein